MFSGSVEIEPGLKLFKFDLSANYFSRNYQKVSEKHFFSSSSNWYNKRIPLTLLCLVVTKGHTYLNKSATKSCMSV